MLPASLAYYGTTGIDPTLVRLLVTTYFAANAYSAMPVAVAVGAVGLASVRVRGTILPGWFALASTTAATLQLGATFTLLGGGDIFSPHGAYGTTVLFGSLTIWTLTASVLLLTRAKQHQPPSR